MTGGRVEGVGTPLPGLRVLESPFVPPGQMYLIDEARLREAARETLARLRERIQWWSLAFSELAEQERAVAQARRDATERVQLGLMDVLVELGHARGEWPLPDSPPATGRVASAYAAGIVLRRFRDHPPTFKGLFSAYGFDRQLTRMRAEQRVALSVQPPTSFLRGVMGAG